MQQIICFDPRKQSIPGTIVEPTQVPRLEAAEVALLPVDRTRIYQGPCDTFTQRFAGEDGWHFNGNRATRGLHVYMRLAETGLYQLHWCARIAPIDEHSLMSGKLKLVTDGSTGALSGGLTPKIRIDEIPNKLDRYGGITIKGVSEYNTSIEGTMSLCLHGIMNNVRIQSLSVSAIS